MRTTGVAVLGLFTGFLTATVLIEVWARLFLDGPPSPGTVAFLGTAPQALAIIGAVVAVLIDRRLRRERGR